MLHRAASIVVAFLLPSIAAAEGVILSVFGADGVAAAEYTLEQLDELDQVSYTTSNTFIDGEAVFSGPLITTVLADANAEMTSDEAVKVTAINEYAVEIPGEDLANYDVILATRMNGEEMSIRDKGPIWVMYPISDFPELSDGLYSSRLIWQVSSLAPVE